MRTPRYISRTIGFIKNLNTKENTTTTTNFELTNTRLGVSLKKTTRPKKSTGSSLLSLLYSEENSNLFI